MAMTTCNLATVNKTQGLQIMCRKKDRDREREKDPYKVIEITPPPKNLGIRCFPPQERSQKHGGNLSPVEKGCLQLHRQDEQWEVVTSSPPSQGTQRTRIVGVVVGFSKEYAMWGECDDRRSDVHCFVGDL